MINYEIKVKIQHNKNILPVIKRTGAVYKGCMRQVDRYLKTGAFKDKIREINADEVQRIIYRRTEKIGRKKSKYAVKIITQKGKTALLKVNKAICVVRKVRKLWIYKNTRIHLDKVVDLGYFMEIETVIKDISPQKGHKEFKEVLGLLKINPKNSVIGSYSDFILRNKSLCLLLNNGDSIGFSGKLLKNEQDKCTG